MAVTKGCRGSFYCLADPLTLVVGRIKSQYLDSYEGSADDGVGKRKRTEAKVSASKRDAFIWLALSYRIQ